MKASRQKGGEQRDAPTGLVMHRTRWRLACLGIYDQASQWLLRRVPGAHRGLICLPLTHRMRNEVVEILTPALVSGSHAGRTVSWEGEQKQRVGTRKEYKLRSIEDSQKNRSEGSPRSSSRSEKGEPHGISSGVKFSPDRARRQRRLECRIAGSVPGKHLGDEHYAPAALPTRADHWPAAHGKRLKAEDLGQSGSSVPPLPRPIGGDRAG